MEMAMVLLIHAGSLLLTTLAYPSCPGDCYFGDYLVVRLPDVDDCASPSCPELNITTGLFNSKELCFAKACELGGNVIHYRPWNTGHYCAIYKCNSNNLGTDWDYAWVDKTIFPQIYAKPHSYFPRCHSSYFVRRTWRSDVLPVESQCHPISTNIVADLRECMSAACQDKANVFNFYPDEVPLRCETKHCKWRVTANDYDFDYNINLFNSVWVYSLSHSTIPCDSDLIKSEPIQLYPKECERTALCGQGTAEEMFCKGESNIVIHYLNSTQSSIAWTCGINHEGTAWQLFYRNNDTCYVSNDYIDWLLEPYPGTPLCNSSIYMTKQHKNQCFKSMCSQSVMIHQARDLRQCMLYACEYGANVINYYSTENIVECDIRFCSFTENGKYDLKLEHSSPGYDIYALVIQARTSTVTASISTESGTPSTYTLTETFAPSSMLVTSTVNVKTSKASITTTEPYTHNTHPPLNNDTMKNTIQNNTASLTFITTIALGIILFFAICVIAVLTFVCRKQEITISQQRKRITVAHNPVSENITIEGVDNIYEHIHEGNNEIITGDSRDECTQNQDGSCDDYLTMPNSGQGIQQRLEKPKYTSPNPWPTNKEKSKNKSIQIHSGCSTEYAVPTPFQNNIGNPKYDNIQIGPPEDCSK